MNELQKLQSHESETYLRQIGVKHLYVFGSFARGEQTNESDIDIMYDEDAYLYPLPSQIINYVQKLTGRKCDLVRLNDVQWNDGLKGHSAEKERIRIF